MDFYHSPVAVWVNSAPQPKRWGPWAHRGIWTGKALLTNNTSDIWNANLQDMSGWNIYLFQNILIRTWYIKLSMVIKSINFNYRVLKFIIIYYTLSHPVTNLCSVGHTHALIIMEYIFQVLPNLSLITPWLLNHLTIIQEIWASKLRVAILNC